MDIPTRKTSLGWTLPMPNANATLRAHMMMRRRAMVDRAMGPPFPDHPLAGLGSLDPLRTTVLVGSSALGSAALPATIGVILAATKHPKGAKAAFIIAGIFAAVGAAGGIFAAQSYAETVKGEL